MRTPLQIIALLAMLAGAFAMVHVGSYRDGYKDGYRDGERDACNKILEMVTQRLQERTGNLPGMPK